MEAVRTVERDHQLRMVIKSFNNFCKRERWFRKSKDKGKSKFFKNKKMN